MTEEAIRLLSGIKEAETAQKEAIVGARAEAEAIISRARDEAAGIDARVKLRVQEAAADILATIDNNCAQNLQLQDAAHQEARSALRKAAEANRFVAVETARRLFRENVAGGEL
jgi:vacuolar-type H+-ATPase subunit H